MTRDQSISPTKRESTKRDSVLRDKHDLRIEEMRQSQEKFKEIEENVSNSIQPYMSIVINSAFSFIEGYFLKKIDKKNFYQINFFHLRYVRMVFQANVIIIKNDRSDSKVNKEIPLSELIRVELTSTKDKTMV